MKNISVFLLTSLISIMVLSGCSKDSGSSRPTFNNPTNPSNPGNNPVCIAVDTDGDGLRDCEDPDIDNDGILNADDAFPYDWREKVDTDSDGYGDALADKFPTDPLEWADSDADTIGDNADPDDDNDGAPDRWDSFRTRDSEQFDIDFDSLGNDEDPDSDNDGVPDAWDDLYWRAGSFDIDHDLVPNESDPDIDGDNAVNELDAFPYDPTESLDYDSDTIGNNKDPDDDNDGVPDVWDAFPLNRNYQFDWDGDGFANVIDVFPYDPNEWLDTDGDGYGDNGDAFPNNPSEWADTDQDGVGNNTDPDIDNDGFTNQLPAKEVLQVECFAQRNESTCIAISGCGWTSQGRCAPVGSCIAGGLQAQCLEGNGNPYPLCSALTNSNPRYPIITPSSCNADAGCTWNGSSCDQLDYFPLDKLEHLDADLDGLGDDQDPDDDNDGFPDIYDDFKFRRDAFFDFDVDGIYDWQLPIYSQESLATPAGQYAQKIDPDSDNDGVPDLWDDLKWDAAEYYDIDGDGIGSNLDQDDDGDGVADVVDAFPFDPEESLDTDFDTIGNNADPDDDNDGAPDIWDSLIYNRLGFSDLNEDGVPDDEATDIDGDLYSNGPIACIGVANNFACSFPESIDVFIWDDREWYDEEPDGLGDNEDPDDDNDGAPDLWDDMEYNSQGFADLDNDNIPNDLDDDIDGDQVENSVDIFPYDDTEWLDTDGDTIGDNTDSDPDNDGVPMDWDDFPLDNRYWADNDGDGISNELDIYTPNGINNETELQTALARGEQITFTSGFNITQCYNIPGEREVSSNDDPVTLTYMGPNDGCMFNVVGHNTSFDNIIFKMPASKQGTFIRSNISTGSTAFVMHQNTFDIQGKTKILDITIKGLIGFTRNNLILNTNTNLAGTGYENLIVLRNGTGLVTTDDVGFIFGGNIIFWKINVTQTAAISIFKALNPVRSVGIQNNALKLTKAAAANIVAPTSFVNFDFTSSGATNEHLGILVSQNRINLNAGQFVNMTSASNSFNEELVLAQGNKIYGATTLGNPVIDQDNSDESANICVAYEEENDCEALSQCDWSGAACIGNGETPKSYSTYYDFVEEDVWLAPSRGDYSMFYYPNTGKINNSPAMFDGSFYDTELDVYLVDELDLGQGKVYFIGFYPPVLDDDMDTFKNANDVYPLNPNEWYNNDNDSQGNNTDSDDDNDEVLDFAEKSYCAPELSAFTCNVKTGCDWDEESFSCRRDAQGCLVSGSTFDYSAMCCMKDGACVDGSDPFVADSDGDGLTDYQEMNTYGTNPISADSDNDGDNDSDEISYGSDPLDPNSSRDTDLDGMNDNYEIDNLIPLGCILPQTTADTDGDGLNDKQEFQVLGTNPCLSDTDGDGLTDFEEVNTYLTNPTVADTDGDGLSDGAEVLTHNTNPKVSDSDGDGASDGQEVSDGTSPTSASSFKDTDGDLESDYVDRTPYGATPCDNFSLGTCTNTYSNTQLRDRLNQQIAESYTCASKTSSVSCTTNAFDLCKWNAATTTCQPKDVVVFHDITLDDRCYTIPLAAANKTNTLKIRSRPNTRKNLTLSNNLATASGCNAGEGVFTLLANTGLSLEGIHFNVGNQIENVISNTVSTNRGGFSLETKKVSFYSDRSLGARFVKLRDYAKVSMEQTTIRQVLSSTPAADPGSAIDLTYTGAFCAGKTQSICEASGAICSWTGSACVDRNITQLTMKGNLFSCETGSALNSMYSSGRVYSCIKTQSPTTDFDGNVLMLLDNAGLNPIDVTDPSNEIFVWSHSQGSGSFILRNSRIFSSSQSMSVTNASSSVTSSNLSIRNGANTDQFEWSGSGAPSTELVAGSATYNGVFRTTTSAELSCVAGTSGDSSTIHPAYFNANPVRSFWYLINRTGPSDAVQIPGAVGSLCVP